MNTTAAYLARIAAARAAAAELATADRTLQRRDEQRAQRLAEYAQLCAHRARAAADSSGHALLALTAQDYANDAQRSAADLRARRIACSRIRIAAKLNGREILGEALAAMHSSRAATTTERELTEAAYLRLTTLPAARPAVEALSWKLVRYLEWDAEIIAQIRERA